MKVVVVVVVINGLLCWAEVSVALQFVKVGQLELEEKAERDRSINNLQTNIVINSAARIKEIERAIFLGGESNYIATYTRDE